MRILGHPIHPIHPMLVHFPIAFWTAATAAYGWAAFGASELAATLAKISNGAGLCLAMLAGALELRSIDSRSEAMRVATRHMMVMATVWNCFLLALLLSVSAGFDSTAARLGESACSIAGFALMGVGGWLGGRLVYEFGIAVRKDSKF